MTIGRWLWLAAVIISCWALLVAFTVYKSLVGMERAANKEDFAGRVVREVSDLNSLSYGYLLLKTERPKVQWQLKHASLGKLLLSHKSESPEERAILERLRENHGKLKGLFDALSARTAQNRRSSPKALSLFDELNESLTARLLVSAEIMVHDASSFARTANREAEGLRRTSLIIILVATVLLILFSVATSALLARRIGSSIRDLEQGAKRIAAGDLSYRIGVSGDDEIGHLGASFNDMAGKVDGLYRRLEAEGEQRYRTLFDSMTEGFALHEILTDGAGRPCDYRFLDVNPAFEHLTGLKRDRLLGKRVLEVLPGAEAHWIETYGKVALTGEPAHFENFATLLDRWYEVFAYRPAPGQFAVVFTDITARKRAEEEGKRLIAELEAAVGELEGFTYTVSHDLRAPVRHIVSFASLLKKDAWPVLGEQSRHFLDTVLAASGKMGLLVDELLQFSRMGRVEMKKSRLDLDALIGEVILGFAEETKSRDVRWRLAPLPAVRGDASMLQLVFANLIGNALKFTRGSSPVSIEIGHSNTGAEHVISVRDNGVGFDMRYVDKLFGVFQRLHNEEEFEGTGIGLANVQRIVHRHGGRIWAEGKVGEGATFSIALPKGEEDG
jgi:PAS domain S-box-containing protein